MSFVQFLSERKKDKIRQELREEREQMLEKAKKRVEQRADCEVKRLLKGENNWMLPSVEEKLRAKNEEIKKSKKKKKEKKKDKKSKKRSRKKRKYSSSDEDEDSYSSESSTSSDDTDISCSEKEYGKRKKSKKYKKKNKKSKKSKKSSSSENENEKESCKESKSVENLTRDSWMINPLILKTYSKERVEHKPNEKQKIDAYDPAKSSRELNPYWKITGTGLPVFRKPKDNDDNPKGNLEKSLFSTGTSSSKGWRKRYDKIISTDESPSLQRDKSPTHGEIMSPNGDEKLKNCNGNTVTTLKFLTDQQMNELGAKVLKAEIMGDMSLAEELRKELENARTQRNNIKERQKSSFMTGNSNETLFKTDKPSKSAIEHIILTHTDQAGNTRPLPKSKAVDPRDLYGGKKKQKRVNTHNEHGERIRYFANDDRYNLKEMFEREKYMSASDSNLEFANIASKHKNPNDDMEDIFAEKICKDDSSRSERKDRDQAIHEHQKMEAILDNCNKCFDSTKMRKDLLVCVGENVYLALPWHQGLQQGHCMIIPNQHAICCTGIDEDTWAEINDFRKALTRMFAAQRKDVIFFEIANRLHRRAHLVIHCIPISESDGEMAPFYFRKAIEESEHEWCVNKQLVSLHHKSLRSCIPKGLPYFWVNFGMDAGFAHVIEDEERFPANFAQEIIGGMLNLDANKWRKLQKNQNNIIEVKLFADWWKKYDCTKS